MVPSWPVPSYSYDIAGCEWGRGANNLLWGDWPRGLRPSLMFLVPPLAVFKDNNLVILTSLSWKSSFSLHWSVFISLWTYYTASLLKWKTKAYINQLPSPVTMYLLLPAWNFLNVFFILAAYRWFSPFHCVSDSVRYCPTTPSKLLIFRPIMTLELWTPITNPILNPIFKFLWAHI